MKIRDFLNRHGGVEKIDYSIRPEALNYDFGDKEPLLCTVADGRLNVTCCGDVIFAFPRNHIGSWQYLLIRDDSEGKEWDRNKKKGLNKLKPRPMAKLRLVCAG